MFHSTCYFHTYNIKFIHHVSVTAPDSLQLEADSVAEWATSKRLRLNVRKTQLITISRCSVAPPSVYMNGILIEEKSEMRILGVMFSSTTSWEAQHTLLYERCCRSLSLVKRLWLNNVSPSILWQAYLGLVFSHIAWCWPVICDLPKKHLVKYERLERTVARWSRTAPSQSLTIRLDDIAERLAKRVATHSDKHPLATFFVIRAPTTSLRRQRVLLPPASRHKYFLNTFIRYCSRT